MNDGIESNRGGVTGDAEFDEFNEGADVTVGDAEGSAKKEPAAKPKTPAKPKAAAAKPAAAEAGDEGDEEKPKAGAAEAGDEAGDEGDDGDEGEGDEGEPKPRKKASERIRELNTRLRREERLRLASDERLAALEKSLQGNRGGGNAAPEIGKAPDPTDSTKYPLGHLDDRYIEDKLDWLAEQKAAQRADAVLQRQQETEQTQRAETARQELLGKVDDLASRGSELFEDFQEAVVDAGMKGDWPLSQATFEAAHEADHGAQILYDLSKDKAEAKRVSQLSPYQQTKYVLDRNAEIDAKAKPRTKPGAGEPPKTQTRGASSRTALDPATDNLDDFEKAWEADAKRTR
jgi:hypothetical protein